QNNPNGSFHAPFIEPGGEVPAEWRATAERLVSANTSLNTMKIGSLSSEIETQPLGTGSQAVAQRASSLEQKYLNLSRLQEQKNLRTKETAPIQQKITRDQFVNILRQQSTSFESQGDWDSRNIQETPAFSESFDVEVAPMQSLLIDERELLIFRRIAIENQIYRQGFVVLLDNILNHLKVAYFEGQPLENFTLLELNLTTREQAENAPIRTALFTLTRTFPRPFSFLRATIHAQRLPGSPERTILNAMRLLLGFIMILGLAAMYQSTRTIFELSERRATFVSSVTHELKTPLTNIRMYAEMLEQGIAPTREREEG
ncbi:MAG: hypothetical protein GY801_18115, partial [bacterium]|nr:hypothetical protein [bacterium]